MILIYGVETMSWQVVDGHHLERRFSFTDFVSALAFVNECGAICEAQNHHAEFTLGWGSVTVRTWSHDVNGITERDHKLASSIDEVMG